MVDINEYDITEDYINLYSCHEHDDSPISILKRLMTINEYNLPAKFTVNNTHSTFFYIRLKCIFDENQQFHSYNDQPAFIFEHSDTGIGKRISWYNHGKLHRINKPAEIIYLGEGSHLHHYYENDKHPLNKLTKQEFKNSILSSEMYTYEDQITHEIWFNGPFKSQEYWYKNRELHRIGGPAIVVYFDQSTQACFEEWRINGQITRYDGPAVIYYKSKNKLSLISKRITNIIKTVFNSHNEYQNQVYVDTVIESYSWYVKNKKIENDIPSRWPLCQSEIIKFKLQHM